MDFDKQWNRILAKRRRLGMMSTLLLGGGTGAWCIYQQGDSKNIATQHKLDHLLDTYEATLDLQLAKDRDSLLRRVEEIEILLKGES